MMRLARITPIVLALAATAASAHAQQPAYHVATKVTLGGTGGWDYLTVDTTMHRVFISRSSHVMVVDADRDSVIGDIANTSGVHGIALAPELGRGFTSNGRDSTVTVFDYKTLAPLSTVKVTGRNPDAILYDPATKHVYTFNGGSGDATVIDAATGNVLGTIALGGKPEAAVPDGNGGVFVNIEDKSEIAHFDGHSMAVTSRWSIAPCEEPSGLGFDRAHARLFAACGNAMMAIVNATTGKLVTTVATGQGSDGAAFDAATQLAFTTNGEGTLSVVHEDTPDKYTLVGNAPTQRGARTIALDERTHKVYTVTAAFGPAPAPTADRPRPRPPMIPDSFTLIVLER